PVEIPPAGGRLGGRAREQRGLGDEQGRSLAQAETDEDLLHLVSEERGADPQPGGDGAAAYPAEAPTQLVPCIPLSLRNRIRDEAPGVIVALLTERVDAPVAALEHRDGFRVQPVTGLPSNRLAEQQPLRLDSQHRTAGADRG